MLSDNELARDIIFLISVLPDGLYHYDLAKMLERNIH